MPPGVRPVALRWGLRTEKCRGPSRTAPPGGGVRLMVEAAGLEPASEDTSPGGTTRVSDLLELSRPLPPIGGLQRYASP